MIYFLPARVPFAVRDAPGWVWGFLIDLAKTGKEDAEVRAVTFDAGASTGTELKQKLTSASLQQCPTLKLKASRSSLADIGCVWTRNKGGAYF
eukprot:scaffold114420_cov67-Cyclotella_meneghiniana.AAC.4